MRAEGAGVASGARPRFVMVCHEATRTGAVKVAVQTLEAIPGEQFEKVVIVKDGGPLLPDLERTADHVVVRPQRLLTLASRQLARLPLAARSDELVPRLQVRRWRPDVLWANTIFSADYLSPAVRLGAVAVLHAHELGPMVPKLVERYRLRELGEGFFPVACSDAGRQELAKALGTGQEGIQLIRSAVDVERVQSRAEATADNWAAADQDGPALVVGCGSVNKRKGPDLFLRVARSVLQATPPDRVRFVWVGGGPDLESMRQRSSEDGFSGAVEFVGEVADPHRLMSRSRLFVLTSRRESFPLVTLEALALGRPVVAFDVGDVREQLQGCGVVLDAGDVEGMAAAVINLVEDRALADGLGAAGRARVEQLYDVGNYREDLTSLIRRLLL